MSITACEYIRESPSLDTSVTTIRVEYLITASAYMRESAVSTATFTGKPTVSTDTHDVVTNAYLASIDEITFITEDGTNWYYAYNVTFKTPESSTPAPNTDPEVELPDIEWGGSDQTETVYFDINGNPIENRAHQAYENMPTRESGDACVVITRNESDNNAALWNSYSNSINSSTWYGNSAYQCKLGRISAKLTYRGDLTYWRVTYPIYFKENTWRITLANVGTAIYDPVSNQLKELIDKTTNEKYTSPVKLSSDGTAMLSDQGSTPITDTYPIYKETSWGTLSLPNPF